LRAERQMGQMAGMGSRIIRSVAVDEGWAARFWSLYWETGKSWHLFRVLAGVSLGALARRWLMTTAADWSVLWAGLIGAAGVEVLTLVRSSYMALGQQRNEARAALRTIDDERLAAETAAKNAQPSASDIERAQDDRIREAMRETLVHCDQTHAEDAWSIFGRCGAALIPPGDTLKELGRLWIPQFEGYHGRAERAATQLLPILERDNLVLRPGYPLDDKRARWNLTPAGERLYKRALREHPPRPKHP
jgi:hypothetical protein